MSLSFISLQRPHVLFIVLCVQFQALEAAQHCCDTHVSLFLYTAINHRVHHVIHHMSTLTNITSHIGIVRRTWNRRAGVVPASRSCSRRHTLVMAYCVLYCDWFCNFSTADCRMGSLCERKPGGCVVLPPSSHGLGGRGFQ